jgi:hypothetical protein
MDHGGRTRGSTDRRTPLLDNLFLTPVPPLHDELAIHRLLRSNSSSVANAVLFFTRNNIVTFLYSRIMTNNSGFQVGMTVSSHHSNALVISLRAASLR